MFYGSLKREKQWEKQVINPHMEIKAGQTKKTTTKKKPNQRNEFHFTFQAVIQISKTRSFVVSINIAN